MKATIRMLSNRGGHNDTHSIIQDDALSWGALSDGLSGNPAIWQGIYGIDGTSGCETGTSPKTKWKA